MNHSHVRNVAVKILYCFNFYTYYHIIDISEYYNNKWLTKFNSIKNKVLVTNVILLTVSRTFYEYIHMHFYAFIFNINWKCLKATNYSWEAEVVDNNCSEFIMISIQLATAYFLTLRPVLSWNWSSAFALYGTLPHIIENYGIFQWNEQFILIEGSPGFSICTSNLVHTGFLILVVWLLGKCYLCVKLSFSMHFSSGKIWECKWG